MAQPPTFDANNYGAPQQPEQPQNNFGTQPQNNAYGAPQQPEPKKPWYKKKRFIIPIAIFAVLVIIGAISGGEEKDSASSSSSTSNTGTSNNNAGGDAATADNGGEEAPEAAPAEGSDSDTVAIGETANTGQADITISNMRAESDVLGSYICADVNFVNTDDEAVNVNPLADLKLTDPSNVSINPTFAGPSSNMDSVEVGAGGNRAYTACFDSDGAPGEYKITYELMFSFQSKEKTWVGNL